jgi:hypothetical protein
MLRLTTSAQIDGNTYVGRSFVMYGKYVYIHNGNTKVWVSGTPSYTKEKWQELALAKYQLYVEGKITDLLS